MLFDDLTEGAALAALLGSVVAGVHNPGLVAYSRFEPARYTAAVAVGSIIAGWGLAQSPTFLPGLTVEEAAAGNSTLIPLLVGLGIGAFILVPSLLCFSGSCWPGASTLTLPALRPQHRKEPPRHSPRRRSRSLWVWASAPLWLLSLRPHPGSRCLPSLS